MSATKLQGASLFFLFAAIYRLCAVTGIEDPSGRRTNASKQCYPIAGQPNPMSPPSGRASPDVGTANLAVDAWSILGRVNLELGVFEARADERRSVFVDRDRARDASRPCVEGLLHRWVQRLELDHVGDREPASRTTNQERILDNGDLVIVQVVQVVGSHDND